MNDFLKKILFFISLIIVISYPIGNVLNFYGVNNLNNKLFWLFKIENKSFDDGFLGSSRTYMMFNHNVWFNKTGKKSINLSIDGSGMADHYLSLVKFLQTNTLNRLFLQIDVGSINNNFSYPFRDYVWSFYLDNPIVNEVYSEEVSLVKKKLVRIHPFVKWLYFNRKLPLFENEDMTNSLTKNGGTYYNDRPFILNQNWVDNGPIKLKPSKSFYRNFNRITKLVDEYEIELIIYTAPVHPVYLQNISLRTFNTFMDSLTSANNLKWINFYEYNMGKDSLMYRDITHLNSQGTKVFTSLLADSMLILGNQESN